MYLSVVIIKEDYNADIGFYISRHLHVYSRLLGITNYMSGSRVEMSILMETIN